MLTSRAIRAVSQQLFPNRAQPFSIDPPLDISEVDPIPLGSQDCIDISRMLGLVAEAIIPELVEDQIFGRMNVEPAILGA
jgi:hypothetical protein